MSDSEVLKRETSSRFQHAEESVSYRVLPQDYEPNLDPEPAYPGLAASSSSNPSSPPPPPFSTLYFPPASAKTAVDQAKACVTEPDPSTLSSFAPAPQSNSPSTFLSAAEVEVKAALPRDTKSLDDGEPPPPYTEGSSPLDGFTYVMAAAGGAASIITQVQQGAPAPVTTLGGTMKRIAVASVLGAKQNMTDKTLQMWAQTNTSRWT